MTQTFDSSLSSDKDWVRFHIADTNTDGMYIDDETINYFINDSSKQQAVITCIDNIIAQLSSPDTKLDWLSVSYEQARVGYEKLLARKKKEFGISGGVSMSSSFASRYRADSDQTDGDYSLDADS